LNRNPNTRRASPLSDEERLRLALAEIERLRAELRLEQALGQIERAADDLCKLTELQAERLALKRAARPWWRRLAG
jgi:hypothetical protein